MRKSYGKTRRRRASSTSAPSGISYSTDAGVNWRPLQFNLPTVPVHDLQVKDDDLVVGTHGRSLWILDDLAALRGWTDSLKEKPLHLYAARPATKWSGGGGNVSGHHRGSSTRDPERGAVLWYYFAKEPKEAKLEILAADGKVIAKAGGKPDADEKDDEVDDGQDKKERKLSVKPGLNRFVWDFTHDGADTIPGAKVDAGNPGMGIPVSIGKYTAKLTVGKESQAVAIEVLPDPRLDSKSYAGEQELLALKVRDQIQSLTETVKKIRSLQKQIAIRKDLFKEDAEAKGLLQAEAEYGEKLAAIEERLHNPKAKIVYDIFAARGGAMLYSQLTWLLGNVTEGEGAPTKPQLELAEELTKQLNAGLTEFEKLATVEFKKLGEAAKKAGVPELYLPAKKKPGTTIDARR